MKILCLHGFRHNGELLKKSMSSMVNKFAKQNIYFDFVDSPINYVDASNIEDVKTIDYKQWWSATRENINELKKYDTIEESLNFVLDKWNIGEYDGILGFSQGSLLAQIFVYNIQNNLIKTYPPKFIILCSPFPVTDVAHNKIYETSLKYPCFVMLGAKDDLIKNDLTLQVVKCITNCTVYTHVGGHYVSSNSQTCDCLLRFLQNANQ